MTAEANRLRDEIKTLESTIEKCEEDKMTKDSQIRTLRDEIAFDAMRGLRGDCILLPTVKRLYLIPCAVCKVIVFCYPH